jgi:ADP-ribose pyrophosphatase YjhB (NUDIX family)
MEASMYIPHWLEPVLRFGLWVCRAKYLVGVFPVCIDDANRVLLIYKRLGAATGWQLPGGGKRYGRELEVSACQELFTETGLVAYPGCLELVHVQCIERHRDLNFAYAVRSWEGEPKPRDTFEISEVRWVPIVDAYYMLYPLHRPMLLAALEFHHLGYK